MHTTNLRKVGGSVMLAVPPALLEQLHMQAGASVGVAISDGKLIVEPAMKPKYTLDELLLASDYKQDLSDLDREWIDTPAAGNELL